MFEKLLTLNQESPHEQQQSLLLSRIITNIVGDEDPAVGTLFNNFAGEIE